MYYITIYHSAIQSYRISHFPYSYAYILLCILLSIIVIILYLGPDGKVLSIESEGRKLCSGSPLLPLRRWSRQRCQDMLGLRAPSREMSGRGAWAGNAETRKSVASLRDRVLDCSFPRPRDCTGPAPSLVQGVGTASPGNLLGKALLLPTVSSEGHTQGFQRWWWRKFPEKEVWTAIPPE